MFHVRAGIFASDAGAPKEDTAEYGARDDADPKGMQRVVDELLEKVTVDDSFLSYVRLNN